MSTLVPPKTLDISWSDLFFALRMAVTPQRLVLARTRLEYAWSEAGDAFACASVRTGFDLWLQAMGFAEGDEIIVSAVTLPDMIRIIDAHGLVAVPVDIDPATMAPTADAVQAAITPRTRAIVIAHLFGGRVTLAPFARVARRHGLLLVEDCAQAFVPGADRARSRIADVSMYSFGPIKTATALGGAILEVRDAAARRRMRTLEDAYPLQPTRRFAARAAKYCVMKQATVPQVYGALAAGLAAVGQDASQVAKKASRGFAGAAADLLAAIRIRPSAALLRLLARRIATPADAVRERAEVSAWLARTLPRELEVPGSRALEPTYWLFPVAVENPGELCAALRAAGFDASSGTTSLAAIAAPAGRKQPVVAQALMPQMVYLPVNADLGRDQLLRLVRVVTAIARPRRMAAATAPARVSTRMQVAS